MTGRIPDKAHDAFDYMMNMRTTYDMLGQAVGFFNRQLKRNRVTPTQELTGYGGYLSEFNKRWAKLLREAIRIALKDRAKCFPEEHPDWIGEYGKATFNEHIMRLDLKYSDQWS